jgi:hypothetical protein
MFDPTIDTAIFLSAAFALGLALGWALWQLGTAEKLTGATSESEFWQQRLNQARQERDLDQMKIETLDRELNKLKKRLRAS